ncbi:heat shock cognate 70 kDa protein-like protein [Tanacetum coccineum]
MSIRVKGAAIGIDLGTTYSCVAVWFTDPHVQKALDLWPFKMNVDAEDYIRREVTDAVITYFNNQQQEAIAGLNRKKKNVFVFDLGGGTFDVPLFEIIKTSAINVKVVGGDTHLGGEDYDKTLVNYCINEFNKKHWEVDIRGNARAMARLKVACEKAKKDLSSTSGTLIEIDCLYNDIDFLTKIRKMKKEDVNEVVVVGGSTRIPKVRQMVEDKAVAFGAAILAACLSGMNHKSLRCIVLRDIAPHSLGIEVQQPNGEKVELNKGRYLGVPR